ncbi:MAG: M56 family metallopeptidase [Candidatus Aenigmarchaeota archaeon]|nr:M56 family metallopeptidase [Candidatus Aenigmarchaeota archaeon]MDI6722565.1 M56 family metallopeptidase [Candidatus Aenigmarchaeota archaeon]
MIGCFAGFVIDADKLLLIAGSLSVAIVSLIAIKKFRLSTKEKVGLIYSHLIFLSFPFFVLTTDVACGVACMPCGNNISNLAALAFPATLLFSTAAGFFIIPAFYMFFNKKSETENYHIIRFARTHSKRMKIRMPKIYVVDNANPMAFSFRSFSPMMFLSAGIIDILNKKEIEAVVLHELWHLKRKASVLTMSSSLLRFFSPLSLLARFHHDSDKEEACADAFAARIQKTGKHLTSARRKMDEFERRKVAL